MSTSEITSITELLESMDTLSAADVLDYLQGEAEELHNYLSNTATRMEATDALTKAIHKMTAKDSGLDMGEVADVITVVKMSVDEIFANDMDDTSIKGLQTLVDEKLDMLSEMDMA